MINRREISTFLFLCANHVSNYIFPIVLFPYLIRVLGLTIFGEWILASSILSLFRLVTTYSFDLTTVAKLTLLNPDARAKSYLISSTLLCRLTLCIATTCVGLLVILHSDERFASLLGIGLIIVLGDSISPNYIYHSYQLLHRATQIRIASRLASLALILSTVKSPLDAWKVPLIEGGSICACNLILLVLAKRWFSLSFSFCSIKRCLIELRDGSQIFFAMLSNQIFTSANLLIVGGTASEVSIAAYSIAERIYSAGRGLTAPVVQTLFPRIVRAKLASSSFRQNIASILLTGFTFLLVLGGGIFLFAAQIVSVVAGEHFPPAVETLKIFAFALPFGLGTFAVPALIACGENRFVLIVTISVGLTGLACSLLITSYYGSNGAAFSFLLAQILNASCLVGRLWYSSDHSLTRA